VAWNRHRQVRRPLDPAAGAAPAKLGKSRTKTPTAIVTAARRLNRAAGTIATSVLIDSAMEHYRGNFHNKAMWTPIVTSLFSMAVSAHGLSDRRHRAHPMRDAVYAAAGIVGLIGTGFHIFNVTKKVGGFSWQNLFYSAPLGAPAAMSLSGLMGFLAERVRDNSPEGEPRVFGLPAARVVAAMTGLSLLGTTAEAGLLHFRGAFHNSAMLLPVTMPPVAAVFLPMRPPARRGRIGPLRSCGWRRRRRWASLVSDCMPMASRAGWEVGATGARTRLRDRRCPHRLPSPGSRSRVSPRSR
jgi:hypothetical protein